MMHVSSTYYYTTPPMSTPSVLWFIYVSTPSVLWFICVQYSLLHVTPPMSTPSVLWFICVQYSLLHDSTNVHAICPVVYIRVHTICPVVYMCSVLTITRDSTNVHAICPVGLASRGQLQLRLYWQTHSAACQVQQRVCGRWLFNCADIKDSSGLWYILIVLILIIFTTLPSNLRQTICECIHLICVVTSGHVTKMAVTPFDIQTRSKLSMMPLHRWTNMLLIACWWCCACLSVCLCLSVTVITCCLSVCLFVSDCYHLLMMLCMSACLSVCLPACLSVSVCLPVCLCLWLLSLADDAVYVCLSVSLSVCVCDCYHLLMMLCMSACLSVCLCVCLSLCLSVCLCL